MGCCFLAGVALLLSLNPCLQAQQPALANLALRDSAEGRNTTADERYRIGAGDLLEIRVFNRPQLSRDAVRVDGRGMIRMPLVDEEIQAACLTESELGKQIAARYLKYQRRPQVDVFIKEYNSQPVAVLGAVEKPGRFQLQRRVRLLELLSFAGGPNDKAGKRIQVAHTGGRSLCQADGKLNPLAVAERPAVAEAGAAIILDASSQTAQGSQPEQIDQAGQIDRAEKAAQSNANPQVMPRNPQLEYDIYNLPETLQGDEKSNPYVQPGDIITIPEAEQAYVVGNVVKPAPVPLKEPTTVSQAIAMVGGALPDTRTTNIRVIRRVAGSASKLELFVDLQEIVKQRAADITLQPGDIVEVPVSGSKRLIRNIYNAIGPAFANLPLYVLR